MRGLLPSLWAVVLVACAHHGGREAGVPALLTGDGAGAALQRLADALGRARLETGAPDPTEEPVLVVLPPPLSPLEDRSPVTPQLFDIVIRGDQCRLEERDGPLRVALPAGSCLPL